MVEDRKAYVGEIVHYVARGSADGHFPPVCRAAVVTTCGDTGDSHTVAGLAVLNPTGMYFEPRLIYDPAVAPGTWHFISEDEKHGCPPHHS